jgi:hypothetical protein
MMPVGESLNVLQIMRPRHSLYLSQNADTHAIHLLGVSAEATIVNDAQSCSQKIHAPRNDRKNQESKQLRARGAISERRQQHEGLLGRAREGQSLSIQTCGNMSLFRDLLVLVNKCSCSDREKG